MFNDQVALTIYNSTDTIKRSESFEAFKAYILHGLEILRSKEQRKYRFISDNDRKALDLALKYNIQLMSQLLMQ